MKLVEAFLTRNPCYRAGRKIKVKGIMLHSVGCPQPRASVFIGNWNQESFDDAVCMPLSTGMRVRCIRPCPGIIGGGIVLPCARMWRLPGQW